MIEDWVCAKITSINLKVQSTEQGKLYTGRQLWSHIKHTQESTANCQVWRNVVDILHWTTTGRHHSSTQLGTILEIYLSLCCLVTRNSCSDCHQELPFMYIQLYTSSLWRHSFVFITCSHWPTVSVHIVQSCQDWVLFSWLYVHCVNMVTNQELDRIILLNVKDTADDF